ncbi:MAG: hypothetical protein AABZ60_18395 [Planctomycetota bacterium]
MIFCENFSFFLGMAVSLDTLMIWGGLGLMIGVLILYWILFFGKEYIPEAERLQMRVLVDDYRTRVTLHLENIDGIFKTIFQMKGLFQNNLFLLTHENIQASFLKQELVLIHLRYPVAGDLLLEIAEKYPNTFLAKISPTFCVYEGGPPPLENGKEFFFFRQEKDLLQAFDSLRTHQNVSGDDFSSLQSKSDYLSGLKGLLDHIENTFNEQQIPCLMAITFDKDYIGIIFVFAPQHRFLLHPLLDKIRMDSLLELFDGMRGAQDDTMEITRSELFSQSSLFRDLNENSELLIMDEIDHEFFDRFPQIKEETQHNFDDLYTKETRKLKPNKEHDTPTELETETEEVEIQNFLENHPEKKSLSHTIETSKIAIEPEFSDLSETRAEKDEEPETPTKKIEP